MALPKELRLNVTKESLLRLRKTGKVLHGSLLKVFYLPTEEKRGFGVIIGASISKKATERNRIRRYIHEAILATIADTPDIAMVMYPKKGIVDAGRDNIKKEVTGLLKKL